MITALAGFLAALFCAGLLLLHATRARSDAFTGHSRRIHIGSFHPSGTPLPEGLPLPHLAQPVFVCRVARLQGEEHFIPVLQRNEQDVSNTTMHCKGKHCRRKYPIQRVTMDDGGAYRCLFRHETTGDTIAVSEERTLHVYPYSWAHAPKPTCPQVTDSVTASTTPPSSSTLSDVVNSTQAIISVGVEQTNKPTQALSPIPVTSTVATTAVERKTLNGASGGHSRRIHIDSFFPSGTPLPDRLPLPHWAQPVYECRVYRLLGEEHFIPVLQRNDRDVLNTTIHYKGKRCRRKYPIQRVTMNDGGTYRCLFRHETTGETIAVSEERTLHVYPYSWAHVLKQTCPQVTDVDSTTASTTPPSSSTLSDVVNSTQAITSGLEHKPMSTHTAETLRATGSTTPSSASSVGVNSTPATSVGVEQTNKPTQVLTPTPATSMVATTAVEQKTPYGASGGASGSQRRIVVIAIPSVFGLVLLILVTACL